MLLTNNVNVNVNVISYIDVDMNLDDFEDENESKKPNAYVNTDEIEDVCFIILHFPYKY